MLKCQLNKQTKIYMKRFKNFSSKFYAHMSVFNKMKGTKLNYLLNILILFFLTLHNECQLKMFFFCLLFHCRFRFRFRIVCNFSVVVHFDGVMNSVNSIQNMYMQLICTVCICVVFAVDV